jgi:hypothetical protein
VSGRTQAVQKRVCVHEDHYPAGCAYLGPKKQYVESASLLPMPAGHLEGEPPAGAVEIKGSDDFMFKVKGVTIEPLEYQVCTITTM